MARGTTLQQLVEMVRDECALSSSSSRGIDHLAYIKRLLKRHYEELCDSFDWTFLRVDNDDAEKVLQAGERFYDFPVKMDMKTTVDCWHFYGNVWVKLDYGIGPMEYTAMNPDTNQRAVPLLKWRASGDNQFEVWPEAASNTDKVRFTGKRKPNPLVSDSDACDMDDILLVLSVSSEILGKQGSKDAPIKADAMSKRMGVMRRLYSDRRKVRMGMGAPSDGTGRGWPRVRAFPATN